MVIVLVSPCHGCVSLVLSSLSHLNPVLCVVLCDLLLWFTRCLFPSILIDVMALVKSSAVTELIRLFKGVMIVGLHVHFVKDGSEQCRSREPTRREGSRG